MLNILRSRTRFSFLMHQPKLGRYTSDSPKSGAGQSMVSLPFCIYVSDCHYCWAVKFRSNWLTAHPLLSYNTTTILLLCICAMLYLAHIILVHVCNVVASYLSAVGEKCLWIFQKRTRPFVRHVPSSAHWQTIEWKVTAIRVVDDNVETGSLNMFILLSYSAEYSVKGAGISWIG